MHPQNVSLVVERCVAQVNGSEQLGAARSSSEQLSLICSPQTTGSHTQKVLLGKREGRGALYKETLYSIYTCVKVKRYQIFYGPIPTRAIHTSPFLFLIDHPLYK